MCMDYESPEFYSDVTRTAKKPHKCGECQREIKPGEKYEYVTGRWDGHFDQFKTCQHCVAAREWLIEQCGSFGYGSVEEDMAEHIGEYGVKSGPLCRLVVGMRNQWQFLRKEGLMPIPVVGRPAEKEAAA